MHVRIVIPDLQRLRTNVGTTNGFTGTESQYARLSSPGKMFTGTGHAGLSVTRNRWSCGHETAITL